MPDSIRVTSAVVVPEAALAVAFTRSSGPGGQNVNKVASKVELRVELDRIEGLSEPARARLRALGRSRIDGEGRLVLTSQRTRDQHRNLEDAREKLRLLVLRATRPPRPRRPTGVPAAAKAVRIAGKRARSRIKQRRGPVREDE